MNWFLQHGEVFSHTIGPPIMNNPQGLMCTIVSESKYCSGITRFTTFSMTSSRNVSNVTFSECWSETTTVWTRFGMHAPWSNKYSQVTYWNEKKDSHFDIISWNQKVCFAECQMRTWNPEHSKFNRCFQHVLLVNWWCYEFCTILRRISPLSFCMICIFW